MPVPDTNKTKVYNYSDSFSAIIYSSDAIEEQFSTYVAKCESNGFTVDAKKCPTAMRLTIRTVIV